MTQIKNDTVAVVNYVSKTADGQTLEQSSDVGPLVYLHGHQNIIQGLEKALEGKQPGDKFNVSLSADQAYGQHDPEAIHSVDIENFGHIEDLAPGMRLQGESEQGPVAFTVVSIDDGQVALDPNHPLAGVDLEFELEVSEVRDATPEEIEHGHVHQANDQAPDQGE